MTRLETNQSLTKTASPRDPSPENEVAIDLASNLARGGPSFRSRTLDRRIFRDLVRKRWGSIPFQLKHRRSAVPDDLCRVSNLNCSSRTIFAWAFRRRSQSFLRDHFVCMHASQPAPTTLARFVFGHPACCVPAVRQIEKELPAAAFHPVKLVKSPPCLATGASGLKLGHTAAAFAAAFAAFSFFLPAFGPASRFPTS